MVARSKKAMPLPLLKPLELGARLQQIRSEWTPEEREHRMLLAEKKLAELAPLLLNIKH